MMSLYNFCIKDADGHIHNLIITESQAIHIMDICKLTFEKKDTRYPPPWVPRHELKPPYIYKKYD